MIDKRIEAHVQFLWDKFNSEIEEIPHIEKINLVTNNKSWVYFPIDDLYNQKYIMYINDKIKEQPKELFEQVLFHEFVHIYDSIKLIKYNINDFKKLMNIYSEIHASEILMDRLLITQNKKPYRLENIVIHNVSIPLYSFMEQTANSLKEEFTFNKQTILKQTYNYKSIYYYIGYILSLEKHGIQYTYNFEYINRSLSDLLYKILNSFIIKNYTPELLIQYENDLKGTILNLVKETLGLA
jgi:hypothetical protein